MKNSLTTTTRIYRMDRRQISFVKFILEAYDNTAVLTTLDAGEGLVRITVAQGCEKIVEDIIHSLMDEIEIVPIDDENHLIGD